MITSLPSMTAFVVVFWLARVVVANSSTVARLFSAFVFWVSRLLSPDTSSAGVWLIWLLTALIFCWACLTCWLSSVTISCCWVWA